MTDQPTPIRAAHESLPRLKVGESVTLHGIRFERVAYGYVIGRATGRTRSLLDIAMMLYRRSQVQHTEPNKYAKILT